MKLEELTVEAAKLSEKDRAVLVSQLLQGLETSSYQVSDDEVVRRMRESEQDPNVMITFDQLVSGINVRAR